MKTVAEIQGLSAKRLEEAKLLLSNGYFEGAFYLAGYSIELMLKARICKHLEIEDFYLKQPEPLKKAYFVHNLEQLLTLSGLRKKYEDETDPSKAGNKALNKKCSWNEAARYDCHVQQKDVGAGGLSTGTRRTSNKTDRWNVQPVDRNAEMEAIYGLSPNVNIGVFAVLHPSLPANA